MSGGRWVRIHQARILLRGWRNQSPLSPTLSALVPRGAREKKRSIGGRELVLILEQVGGGGGVPGVVAGWSFAMVGFQFVPFSFWGLKWDWRQVVEAGLVGRELRVVKKRA